MALASVIPGSVPAQSTLQFPSICNWHAVMMYPAGLDAFLQLNILFYCIFHQFSFDFSRAIVNFLWEQLPATMFYATIFEGLCHDFIAKLKEVIKYLHGKFDPSILKDVKQ